MSEPDNAAETHYRLFIALPVPEPVKAEIERAQAELRQSVPQRVISWTRREQFHLTLRFLGTVEITRVPRLVEVLRAVCQPFSALRLRAERIGCFPNLKFPRVVWVGVHDKTGRLFALQKTVADSVAAFADNQAEGEFTGHITLARVKDIRRPEAATLADHTQRMAGRFFGEWLGGQIELMRSQLSPVGAQHTCLAAMTLGGQSV